MIEMIQKHILENDVLIALFVVLLGWFLFQIKEVVILFFIAYIIMAAIRPLSLHLQKRGMPHVLSVTIPFLSIITLLLLLIVPIIPFFLSQLQSLFMHFPMYLEQVATIVGIPFDQQSVNAFLANEFQAIGSNAISATARVFGGIVATFTVIVLSFYLLLDITRIRLSIAKLATLKYEKRTLLILDTIEEKLGGWLRGQLVLCISIGIISYLFLTIIQLPFALPLAIIAALFEAIPTLGPILSAIPAVIVALTVSPALAITVAFGYFAIQFLENHILVPNIMQKAVGLHPIVVILSVLIGGKVLGIMGAFLSIPFVCLLVILFEFLFMNRK